MAEQTHSGPGYYITALLGRKEERDGNRHIIEHPITLSARVFDSADEATGAAMRYLREQCPGAAVVEVLQTAIDCAEIEVFEWSDGRWNVLFEDGVEVFRGFAIPSSVWCKLAHERMLSTRHCSVPKGTNLYGTVEELRQAISTPPEQDAAHSD